MRWSEAKDDVVVEVILLLPRKFFMHVLCNEDLVEYLPWEFESGGVTVGVEWRWREKSLGKDGLQCMYVRKKWTCFVRNVFCSLCFNLKMKVILI